MVVVVSVTVPSSAVSTATVISTAGSFNKAESETSGRSNAIDGAITNATTDINFKRMFNDGPEVSLKGSPTVSPTTAALCGSEPLPYLTPLISTPSSIIFLALSHAPPALDWKIAIRTPADVTPARRPPSISGPPIKPTNTGTTIAITPGNTISLIEALVEISTHLSYSGVPSAASKIA